MSQRIHPCPPRRRTTPTDTRSRWAAPSCRSWWDPTIRWRPGPERSWQAPPPPPLPASNHAHASAALPIHAMYPRSRPRHEPETAPTLIGADQQVNERVAPRSLMRRGGERSIEQRAELPEVTFPGGLVVGRGVRHRVAVLRPLVDLGAIAGAGLLERPLERGDLLGGHARILIGEPEV